MSGAFGRSAVFIVCASLVFALFPSAAAVTAAEPPGCAVVDGLGPHAAQLQKRFHMHLPPSTEELSGDQVVSGFQSWGAEFDNPSDVTYVNPTISFTSTMDPSLFTYGYDSATPVEEFPVSCTVPSLAPGQRMMASEHIFRSEGWSGTAGYDSSRTVEPLELPAEGGEQTITVTLTLRDARYHPWSWVSIFVEKDPDDVIVSVDHPTNIGDGEQLIPSEPGQLNWTLVNGRLDKTYVFSAVVDRQGGGAAPFTRRPSVAIYVFHQQSGCPSCGTGGSGTIPIPELDGDVPGSGSVVFSIDDPGRTFDLAQMDAYVVFYGSEFNSPEPPPGGTLPACWDRWLWSYTRDFEPGDWTVGKHSYQQFLSAPATDKRVAVNETFDRSFLVDPDAALYPGEVRLGPGGLVSVPPGWTPGAPGAMPIEAVIHPEQDTVLQMSFIEPRSDFTRVEMEAYADTFTGQLGWDDGAPIDVVRSDVTLGCSPVVTNTNDDGWGSLRQAINVANNDEALTTVTFAIPQTDPGFNGQWFTIQPASALPELREPGTTVDGFSQPNTNPNGPEIFLDGSSIPALEKAQGLWLFGDDTTVQGLAIGYFANGVNVAEAAGVTLRGNYLGVDPSGTVAAPNRHSGVEVYYASDVHIGGTSAADRNLISGNGTEWEAGINVDSSTNVWITGNYIGTDRSGANAIPNGVGVSVFGEGNKEGEATGPASSGVWIGGTDPGEGNLISGNTVFGISVGNNVSDIWIQGNRIGTTLDGMSALGNGSGVQCDDCDGGIRLGGGRASTGVIVGGIGTGRGNLISGNNGPGIGMIGGSGYAIQGNLIGTDATGLAPLGNMDGVRIFAAIRDTQIGGDEPSARNVISGNTRFGVFFSGCSSENCEDPVEHAVTGNTVVGNLIGVGSDGVTPLGNWIGVLLFTGDPFANISGNVVRDNVIERNGGSGIGLAGAGVTANTMTGNVIAFNGTLGAGAPGVGLSHGTGRGNRISQNSIHSNHLLGIDLGFDGVTPNDPGDADTGANGLQNFPVLTRVQATGRGLLVMGTIDTPHPASVTVELFASPSADPSGYGEGARFLGTATPDGRGRFQVHLPSVPAGSHISATATDSHGNTSEFSLSVQEGAARDHNGAGKNVFTGRWTSIDVDGSTQYMTIAAGSDGIQVSYQDQYASSCVERDAGPHATISGVGTLNGDVLEVNLGGIKCAGGFSTPPGGNWTLRYDPGTDTFAIDFDDWGGESIWERVGSARSGR